MHVQVKYLAEREVTRALGKDRKHHEGPPGSAELVDLIVWLLINSMKQVTCVRRVCMSVARCIHAHTLTA